MLSKIAVSGLRLSESDLKSLSIIIRNSEHIGCLELINCHLGKSGLKALAEGLRESNVQIDVLDVSFNRHLRKDSLPYLHEICLRTCGLNYWQCGFKQLDLLTFNQNADTEQSSEASAEDDIAQQLEHYGVLNLSKTAIEKHSDTLQRLLRRHQERRVSGQITGYGDGDELYPVTELLRNAENINELQIGESTLTASQIETIGKFIGGKLKVINVFLCPDLSNEAWLAIGEMARNRQAGALLLTATGLTGTKLENLQLSLYPNQLSKLDLSRNEDLDQQFMEILGNFVGNANIQELIMAYCRLSSSSMTTLQKSMTSGKLKRFDISGNASIGMRGFSALGCITENCSVEQLDVSECDPTGDHLWSFEASLSKAKIVKLNVSRNRNIRKRRGMEAITSIVRKSQPQELFIRQCDLDRDSLASFKDSLGEAKLPRLDLGNYFMKGRKVTDAEIDVIVALLPSITEQLTLNRWEVSATQRQKLQSALQQLEKAPLIQFDRSIDDSLRKNASS